MATKITDFMQRATREQFSRDFLFRVKNIQIEGVELLGDQQLLYARTASLPGRNIENKTVNYFGQTFNVPGKSTYPGSEGYSIEFYHDEDLDIRTTLEKATRAVFDNDTSTGQYGMPGLEDYIILEAIGKDLSSKAEFKLVGASVRSVGEIQHEIADGTGEIRTFPATFSYHYYENFAKAKSGSAS
jgi:hypothetical protein